MAISQPRTEESQETRNQKDREEKKQAFLKQGRPLTPPANDARYDRSAENEANFDEAEREERFQQEVNILREARRRASILQEENELSEAENMESGEANLETKSETVKLSSYAGPLLVACFADLMDYTIVLALPGIKTVLSFCLTTLIFLLLFFPKRRYKISGNARLILIDAFILIGLIPLEGLMFPFNLLPFTIAAVGMIYSVDKKFVAKRNSKKFDKKALNENMSNIIRKAYADREVSTKYKHDVRERMRETF